MSLKIIEGEYWWGGLSAEGYNTPYGTETTVAHDLWGNNKGNQAQPILLSSKGRFIWSEEPIKYSLHKGDISIAKEKPWLSIVKWPPLKPLFLIFFSRHLIGQKFYRFDTRSF